MKLRISKLTWRVAAIALVAVVASAFYLMRSATTEVHDVTAAVTRGPIIRSVIATGTVNPVTTVQVGSYVSGPIQSIYADFNAPVKAGQLIAKIDPRPFQVKVDAAKAGLDNARAQLGKDQADLSYKKTTALRNRQLLAAAVVSRDTVDSANSAYRQALAQVALDQANIEQQTAALHDAQVNLDYTNIISPVDGTVVSRNVDVGQTVAASFQTPTLFLIAKDLTQMQVDTNVSESDIGNVHKGTSAEFTVDAFPNRTFEGAVTQVRQAPISIQNVVTYDVVVTVANPELLLKPGMTANVTIVTARRDDVLRVPLQAVRFSPKGAAGVRSHVTDDPLSRNSRLWLRESGGKIVPVSVMTGLDDGNNIEIVSGNLKPGDKVIIDEARPKAQAAAAPGGPMAMRFPH